MAMPPLADVPADAHRLLSLALPDAERHRRGTQLMVVDAIYALREPNHLGRVIGWLERGRDMTLWYVARDEHSSERANEDSLPTVP